MLWVVEKSMFFANDQTRFIDCLKELRLRRLMVDFIPFSHEIQPYPRNTQEAAAFGSTNMIREVMKLGWTPGVWINDNFQFEVWRKHLATKLLNFDSVVTEFGRLNISEPSFIRPCHDLKSFPGTVVAPEKFEEWKDSVLRYTVMAEENVLDEMTPVVVSSIKEIASEHRFFVVDGRVVTGSQYRINGQLVYAPVSDYGAWTFAQKVVNNWQPDKCFVIDIAKLVDRYKVIEFNCINSAGLYSSDVRAIILAIEDLE